MPDPLDSRPQQLLQWFKESIELESKSMSGHALEFDPSRFKYLLNAIELVDSLKKSWFDGFPLPDWMIEGSGYHFEHVVNSMSLVIKELFSTSQYFANRLAHQITYDSKMKIKERRATLLDKAIELAIDDPTSAWKITKEDFMRIFNFPLEFKSDVSERYLENLREDIEESGIIIRGSEITLYQIWAGLEKFSGTDIFTGNKYHFLFTFQNKLDEINYKIWNKYGTGLVNIIHNKLAEGWSLEKAKGFAYKEMIKGTKYYKKFHRADRAIRILLILVNNRLINGEEFGKVIDRYSWTKVSQIFNLYRDYST